MKVFAVNLVEQTDKKAHIENECASHGLDVEVIEAVDGRQLQPQQLAALVHDYPACSLTPGEIGCALSHLDIYQRIIDAQYPLALVLEDDAVLDPHVSDVLKAIETLNANESQPQVYLLSASHYYIDTGKKTLTGDYTLNRIMDAHSTHAYVLNLAAAKALSSFLRPVKYEADRWGYFQQMGIVQVNCIVPAPAVTNDETKAGSVIEQERLKIRKSRSAYFKKLRKREMPLSQKLKRLFLKLLVSVHFVKVVRGKV